MRVLVTGASGFLGARVSDALLARGDEVVGLSRDPERARGSNPTVRWHAWNATGERPPAAAVEGVDAVINLIGEPIDQRWTPEAKQRIRESRERATRNLVDALSAADTRPRALVSQSAVGYYGDRGDVVVDESTPPGSSFDAAVCVAWEAAAGAAEEIGMRVAVLPTGLPLDARAEDPVLGDAAGPRAPSSSTTTPLRAAWLWPIRRRAAGSTCRGFPSTTGRASPCGCGTATPGPAPTTAPRPAP